MCVMRGAGVPNTGGGSGTGAGAGAGTWATEMVVVAALGSPSGPRHPSMWLALKNWKILLST